MPMLTGTQKHNNQLKAFQQAVIMLKPQEAGFSVLKSSALNLKPFSSISNALPRDVCDPCPAFSDNQDGRRGAFLAFRCMSVSTSPDDTFQTPPWQVTTKHASD